MYIAWDIIVSFFVIWNIFYLPVHIAFPGFLRTYFKESYTIEIGTCERDSCKYYVESIIDSLSDVVFFMDILVCCRTIIVDEVKGRTIEISDTEVIFRRYLTGFLLLDVLGIGLPFTDYWLRPIDVATGGGFQRYSRYVALFGLFKFFRIAKLNVIFSRFFRVPPKYKDCKRCFEILLYLGIVTNLGSCLFFYVACDDFSHPRKYSWVDKMDQVDADWEEQWLTGFYFTLFTMTSIGYGSPAPSLESHPVEVVGTLIIMVTGVLFFSVLAGNFISIMHGFNSDETADQLYDMHLFGKTRHLPKKLQDTLGNSIKFMASVNQTSSNPKEFLKDVPTALQRLMFEHTRTAQLMKARVFIPCDYSFVQAVSWEMDSQVYAKGSYLARAGDINSMTDTLILIRSGVAHVLGFDDRTVIDAKKKSQCVGLANGFIRKIRRLFTVSAFTNVECYSMQCHKLQRIFNTHRRQLAPVLDHVIEDVQMCFEKARDNIPMNQSKTPYEEYGKTEQEYEPEFHAEAPPHPPQLTRISSNSGDKLMRGYKLSVRVHEARNMDKLGGRITTIDADPDVYVVVQLLQSREKTQLAHDNAHPSWDEMLLIDAFAYAQPQHTLVIDIMEANFFFCNHVKLGQLSLRVDEILKGVNVDGWYKVPPTASIERKKSAVVVPRSQAEMSNTLVPSTDIDEPALRLSIRVIGSYFSSERRTQEVRECLAKLEKRKEQAVWSAKVFTDWLEAQQNAGAESTDINREHGTMENKRVPRQ